jgi:hypothetical protein
MRIEEMIAPSSRNLASMMTAGLGRRHRCVYERLVKKR